MPDDLGLFVGDVLTAIFITHEVTKILFNDIPVTSLKLSPVPHRCDSHCWYECKTFFLRNMSETFSDITGRNQLQTF